MKRRRFKNMTVFVYLHSDMFRQYLESWLSAHPRVRWYRSGEGLDNAESLTMSETAWRSFCRDYNLNFKAL